MKMAGADHARGRLDLDDEEIDVAECQKAGLGRIGERHGQKMGADIFDDHG